MHFYRRVLWTGEAAAAKNADRHGKVFAKLLAHDIGCHLGSAKHRVQAIVDGHRLIDALPPIRIVVAAL